MIEWLGHSIPPGAAHCFSVGGQDNNKRRARKGSEVKNYPLLTNVPYLGSLSIRCCIYRYRLRVCLIPDFSADSCMRRALHKCPMRGRKTLSVRPTLKKLP